MDFRPGGCVALDDLATATPDLLAGRWALRDVLLSGSTATVWRALDRTTGAAVAVKVLRPELAPDLVQRLTREYEVLRSLDHPHVLRALDLHRSDPTALVVELLPGGDLAARLRREHTLAPAQAVRTTAAVLAALVHAHGRGVVHGDVKAANVLLGPPGRLVLGDFGSAVVTGGTPEHLAPELAGPGGTSRGGDVYAAGALLYELLAGRTPFAGGTDGRSVLERHTHAPVPDLPGLPSALQQVLHALLDKEPLRRPSAAQALAALQAVPGLRRARRLGRQSAPACWGGAGWTPAHDLDPGRTLP